MHRCARVDAVMLPIGVMIMNSIAAGLTSAPPGTVGILPPANPPLGMVHLVRLKALAIGLAVLSLVAVLLEVGPVAAGGSYEPGSAASRTVMWTGINDLLSMSQAQLAQWNDEGIGGFVASIGLLAGVWAAAKASPGIPTPTYRPANSPSRIS